MSLEMLFMTGWCLGAVCGAASMLILAELRK